MIKLKYTKYKFFLNLSFLFSHFHMHPKSLIYKNPNVTVLTILGLTFTVIDSRLETKISF